MSNSKSEAKQWGDFEVTQILGRQFQSSVRASAINPGSTKHLADLTVGKKPGTSNRIEIHFAVFNHLYLCFSFMKLAETL